MVGRPERMSVRPDTVAVMDPVFIWTVVGVVVGAVGVVFAAITYFRAYPKRRLEYAIEVAH